MQVAFWISESTFNTKQTNHCTVVLILYLSLYWCTIYFFILKSILMKSIVFLLSMARFARAILKWRIYSFIDRINGVNEKEKLPSPYRSYTWK